MTFKTPKFETIRSQILRDITSLNNAADVSKDSDYFVRASSIAACAEGQYAHQSWIVRQIFPDTADTEFLELHAATRSIYRKNATFAKGFVRIFGEAGSAFGAGLEIKLGELYYITDQADYIDVMADYIDVPITALNAGEALNVYKETPAMLTAAPSGCQTECVIIEALGGTNTETDKSLLDRLLERIRRPPAGGNKYDFRNWALSIDGVTNAYVYPLRRGLGSVDIAITSANGLPSDELLKTVQDYIDDVRPVTARESLVIAPNAVIVDFDIKVAVQGISLSEAEIETNRVLDDYFKRLAPADPVVISQIEALISDIVGITDRDLISPAHNLTTAVIESIDWFRLGNVTVRLL